MKAGASADVAVALAAGAPARPAQHGSGARPGNASPETASFDSVLTDLQGAGNGTTDVNATAVDPAAEPTSGRPADASANLAAGMPAVPTAASGTAALALSGSVAGVRTPGPHAEAPPVFPAPLAPAADRGSDDSPLDEPSSTPAAVGDGASANAAPGTDPGSLGTGSLNIDALSTTAVTAATAAAPSAPDARFQLPATAGPSGPAKAASATEASWPAARVTAAPVLATRLAAGPLPAAPSTANATPAVATPGVMAPTTQLPAGTAVSGAAATVNPDSAARSIGRSPSAAVSLPATATDASAVLPVAGPPAGPDASTRTPPVQVPSGLPQTTPAAPTSAGGNGAGVNTAVSSAAVGSAQAGSVARGMVSAGPDAFPHPAPAADPASAAATPAAAPAGALATVAPAGTAGGPAQLPTAGGASPQGAHPAPQPALPLQPQLAKPLFTLVGAPHGQHIMTLKVSPEDLGPLTVRAQIDAAGVRIELFAPGDVGREAVRGILPELRKELSDAGFGASLNLSDHSGPGGAGQSGGHNGTGQDRAGSGAQFAAGRDPGGSGSGPGGRNGPPEPRPGHRWDALADGQAIRTARILNGPQTTLDILV